eukprot:COSAG05_NODE_9609_length_612_cov_0.900585_1_plen_22_part_10
MCIVGLDDGRVIFYLYIRSTSR